MFRVSPVYWPWRHHYRVSEVIILHGTAFFGNLASSGHSALDRLGIFDHMKIHGLYPWPPAGPLLPLGILFLNSGLSSIFLDDEPDYFFSFAQQDTPWLYVRCTYYCLLPHHSLSTCNIYHRLKHTWMIVDEGLPTHVGGYCGVG
jgi:hypothetical protein